MNADLELFRRAVGKPPKYKDWRELSDKFEEYLEWSKKNPINTFDRVQASKKGGKESNDQQAAQFKGTVERPLTLEAFCLFATIANWQEFKKAKCRQTKEYLMVLRAIEDTTRMNMINGAVVGMYQQNLVARWHGLSEKVESKTEVKVEKQLTPKEAAEHIKSIQESV